MIIANQFNFINWSIVGTGHDQSCAYTILIETNY